MSAGRTQYPSDVPGHGLVIGGTIPNMQPDVRQQHAAHLRRSTRLPGTPDEIELRKVTCSTVTMNDWHNTTIASPNLTVGFLAIPQNRKRKKFVIINPIGGQTLFYSYKQAPSSLIPVYAGTPSYEQGTDISHDEIWVWCTVAQLFGAYEGVRDVVD